MKTDILAVGGQVFDIGNQTFCALNAFKNGISPEKSGMVNLNGKGNGAAVLAAFADELGMTKEQALKVGACFGGGMCKAEVCGACTGALMALGLKYGMCTDGDYESKQRANSYATRFLDEFAGKHGSYICREVLGCDIATPEGKAYARANGLFANECPKLIESAVLIAEKLINE